MSMQAAWSPVTFGLNVKPRALKNAMVRSRFLMGRLTKRSWDMRLSSFLPHGLPARGEIIGRSKKSWRPAPGAPATRAASSSQVDVAFERDPEIRDHLRA